MKCLINQKNWWWLKIFPTYFNVVPANIYSQCHNQYNPKEHFVFIDNGEDQKSIDYWANHGFMVIVEKNCFEPYLDDPVIVKVENCLYLSSKIWLWIDLALENRHRQYHHLRSNIPADKFFLMLMNQKKSHRDQLFEITKSYHDRSLYSYVDRGYYIKDDVPPTGTPFQTGSSDQRFYNPAWYAQTAFSLVSESQVTGPRRISEKIFKPIAFQHPFLVNSTPGNLQFLRELGFETFNHIIDESYDAINNPLLRLQAIEQVLKDLYNDYKHGLLLFSDGISQQKILHNYNKFYNVDLLFEKEIINPIKEFINT